MTNTSISNAPQTSRFTLKALIVTLLVVAVGGLTGLLIWHNHKVSQQFALDKAEFAQTEDSLQQAYSLVTAQFGAPTEYNYIKDCSHKAAKFETGTLTCGMGYGFFYEVNTPQEGRAMAEKMIAILQANSFSRAGTARLYPPTTADSTQSYSFIAKGDFGCQYEYNAKDKDWHNSILASNSQGGNFTKQTSKPYSAEFGVGCYKTPIRPVYPFEK